MLQFWLIAVAGVYFVYCWVHAGQTLPMKTWRLRLVNSDGTALDVRKGILRYMFALAGLAVGGLGWAWALLDRDRQFLHDRLAGTRIVDVVAPTRGGTD